MGPPGESPLFTSLLPDSREIDGSTWKLWLTTDVTQSGGQSEAAFGFEEGWRRMQMVARRSAAYLRAVHAEDAEATALTIVSPCERALAYLVALVAKVYEPVEPASVS